MYNGSGDDATPEVSPERSQLRILSLTAKLGSITQKCNRPQMRTCMTYILHQNFEHQRTVRNQQGKQHECARRRGHFYCNLFPPLAGPLYSRYRGRWECKDCSLHGGAAENLRKRKSTGFAQLVHNSLLFSVLVSHVVGLNVA